MIAALLACALVQGGGHGPDPGPRAGIAGLGGFRTVSRIDFGASQNRLTAIYLFPDRARWHFESYEPREGAPHQFVYRLGEHVAEMGGGTPSRAVEGASRDVVVLQMELRRAAMLWPDGFEWSTSEDGTRTAPVHLDACCGGRSLGSLAATLAEDRPERIEVRDAEDRVVETIAIEAWQEHAGRHWPRTLAVSGGAGGFTETVESIETRVHYLDLAFRPPDRRASAGAGPRAGDPLPRDLVAMSYAPRTLPPGTGWDAARARAREWIAEARAEVAARGLEVDPVPTFELAEDGTPARCLVRLGAPAFPPPAGFETRDERLGVFLPLQSEREIDSTALARLARALPADARAGTPYVRVHDRARFPIELVLPFEPKE